MKAATSSYRNGSTPTVVLVHGAFCDASIWSGVVPMLLAEGMDVAATANPLRGLVTDAAYLASVVAEIDGPVLLVGHAYGGAVITVAGATAANVVGLVYVAGHALDEGESAVDICSRFPAPLFGPALRPAGASLGGSAQAVELTIRRESFPSVFAADLSPQLAATLAVTQRPVVAAALDEPCPAAAWKAKRSWYAIATESRVLPAGAQRFMAQRAGAEAIEVAASHAIALVQPAIIADLIKRAAGVSS